MSENWDEFLKSDVELEKKTPEVTFEDIQLLSFQIREMREKVSGFEEQLITFHGRMTSIFKTHQERLDNFGQAILKMDQAVKLHAHRLMDNFQGLLDRTQSLENNEEKFHNLIQEQKTVLGKFDNRVLQMKKFISDQQVQLMSSHSLLKKAAENIESLEESEEI